MAEAFAAPEDPAPAAPSTVSAEPAPATTAAASADPMASLEADLTATPKSSAPSDSLLEPPPSPPRKKGFVLQSSLGALFFPGAFGELSPPAPHMRVSFGYEPWRWLLVFGEGELAFASTQRREDPPFTRTFPMWGLGLGVRGTVPLGSRFGLWLEAAPGLMQAVTPAGALGILGFEDAEKLGFSLRGRLGLDWYQIDRHFALFVAGGARFSPSLTYSAGPAGLPLLAEANLGLRYTF